MNGIQTIEGYLQYHAEATPQAVAITAPKASRGLTYSELQALCASVRQTLRSAGIVAEDRVAVVLPNSPEMAAAFLALTSTCVCAPLNPNFRETEFRFYLEDLGIKAVILSEGDHGPARTAAEILGIPIANLQKTVDGPVGFFSLSGLSTTTLAPRLETSPEQIALVLHTSGTTARPKIVPLTQRNLCASAENIRRTLQLTVDDCCLNVMPLFHIHGLIGALLSSIAAGASVACCPPFEADHFFDWWRDIDPTWYTAVPTIHQAVLAQVERNNGPPPHKSLRLIRSSSSSLPPAVMHRLEESFQVPVLESYGMTEASHQMASNPLPPLRRKPGSVGLPAGPEMGILNEAGELLSSGQIGEIVIRGENVTPGYAENPAANASAFTRGWFRTGDQGWQDAEGYFTITGRLKELINRGGEKIAPREIDEVLLEFPGVAQAVTFSVPHPRLGEDVAAAVVLKPGVQATERDLRNHSLKRLTTVKVPSRIIVVEEIPKGGTGKVQRIGLHDKLLPFFTPEYVAPHSDAERALAGFWSEVLGRERIGIRDNFFYLGGDSLLAGRLVARITTAFEVDYSLSDFFHTPTIAEQAELIEHRLIDQITGET